MVNNYKILSEDSIKYLCGLIRDLASVSEGIDNINLADDKTFSNIYIKNLIDKCLEDANAEAEKLVGALTHLTCEETAIQPTLDNSEINVIYLYSANGNPPYQQFLKISEDKLVDLGSTSISLEDYIKVADVAKDYATKVELKAVTDKIGTTTLTTTDTTITGAIEEVKRIAVSALGDKNFFSTAPIGTVLSFAGQTAPHGYLLCNGASYKVADYPDLYAVIGNTYGGDTENFNIPNLIDKFIQGSTTSGTEKEAGLPNITGTFYHDPNAKFSLSGAFSYTEGSSINLQNDAANKNSGYVSFDASKSNAIYGNSDTVQPPALTMVYIIKAFHTNEGVDSKNEVSDPIIEYVDNKISSNLGEKVDYKVVVEDGTRYVKDIVVQDINTWLPNDNSSILINLKKVNGANYSNFQLLCNKQDSKNWSCIVNGAANELWKIRYIDGVRYIDELATMDKVESKYEEATLATPVDWNTLNTKARYYVSGGAIMTNAPMQQPFGELVVETAGDGSVCRVQKFFSFDGRLYMRRWTGSVWNDWYKFDGTAN